ADINATMKHGQFAVAGALHGWGNVNAPPEAVDRAHQQADADARQQIAQADEGLSTSQQIASELTRFGSKFLTARGGGPRLGGLTTPAASAAAAGAEVPTSNLANVLQDAGIDN